MASSDTVSQQLAALEGLVASAPNGITIAEISNRGVVELDRRTLQRRLAILLATGRITSAGSSRATLYLPAAMARRENTSPPSPIQPSLFVERSTAGEEVRSLVTRPESARKPVGYNRNFLESYRPNVSAYLSAAEKTKLHEIGRTTKTDQALIGTHAQGILNRLLIDLSWNSSRLEGNTYSLLDTARLIEKGEAAEGRPATDRQMILNHKAAIEFLVQSAEDIGFNRYTILNLHALLAENLLQDPSAAGRLRTNAVGITQSTYVPASVPQVIDECFAQALANAEAILDPFEQAFFVMVHLPYLQPFEDVNKRVSRLAANIPFIRRNLSPLSFIDVDDASYAHGLLGVYELNRIELLRDVFLWAYERSAARYSAVRQTTGEPDPFRLRYRQQLKQVVGDVVRQNLAQKQAALHVAAWTAANINEADRKRFIEIAESELLGMHEGNFARFQVRPSEYHAWRLNWDAKVPPTLI